VLEVVEVFPDILSLVALPGGGLLTLAVAAAAAVGVHRRLTDATPE